MKVLVVDDEIGIAKSLAWMLDHHGHDPTIAGDGLEAWELFMAEPDSWGMLITDIRMPGLDGINLVRRVRAHGSGVRVVLISGHGDAPDVREFSPAAFLAKPFRRAELLAVMQGA
ncbi:response regulator [Enhygromyxa salina]|nr:response regulator [Enhygromyxa salina]